jgi:hypothetical protein
LLRLATLTVHRLSSRREIFNPTCITVSIPSLCRLLTLAFLAAVLARRGGARCRIVLHTAPIALPVTGLDLVV